MRIIGTCGFCTTGSSAVTDYLSEFEDNQVFDRIEFTIPYLPDGLEDLNYHLNSHYCRDDSSSIAIPRFRRFIQQYGISFHQQYGLSYEDFQRIVNEYIDSLVQFKWNSLRRSDRLLFPSKFYYNVGQRLFRARIIPLLNKTLKRKVHIWPYRDIEVSIKPDNFSIATKDFIKTLLYAIGANDEKNIVLDQPFPGEDPERCFQFFDFAKAIVVDRDPRDVYLFNKKFYTRSNIMPVDRVEDFVNYFRLLRNGMPYRSSTNPNVLCIMFEDLVYNYDITTARIRSFCGLQENKKPRTIFNPVQSMANTQLFYRYPECRKDVEYIEKSLPEYLYDFSNYPKPDIKGIMFDEKKPE